MGLTTIQVADKPTSDRIESKVDVISTNIGSTPLPALISQGNKIISNNIANSSGYSIQTPYTSNIAMGDLVRYNETTDTVYASTYMSSTGIVTNINKKPANGQATEYLKVIRNPYCNGIYFGICTNTDTREIFVDIINIKTSEVKTHNLGVLISISPSQTSYKYSILSVKCFFNIENTMALYIRYADYSASSRYGSLTLLDVSLEESLQIHSSCSCNYDTTTIVPFSDKGYIIGNYYFRVSDDLKAITRASNQLGFSINYLNIYGTIYPNVTYFMVKVSYPSEGSDYINKYYSVVFDENCIPTLTEFTNNSAAVSAYKQWGYIYNNKRKNSYMIDNNWSVYNEVYKDNSSSVTIDERNNRMVLTCSSSSGEYIKIPLITFYADASSFHVEYAFKIDNSLYVCYGMSINEKIIKRFDIDYTKNTATENTTIPDDIAKYFNSANFVMDHYLGSDYIFASTVNTATNIYNHVVQCFNYNDLDPILGVCNNIDNENKICSVALNGVCSINTPNPVGTVLPDVGIYVTKNKINLNQVLKEHMSIIKSIQHISTMMPTVSSLDYKVTINSVDISKSILIPRSSTVYGRTGSSTYTIFTPQISFTSNTQVRVLLFGSSSKVYSIDDILTTEFTVVEFI